MAGKVENPTSANDAVYEKNLRYATHRFTTENIVGVIEPINSITVPNYYMNSFQKGTLMLKYSLVYNNRIFIPI